MDRLAVAAGCPSVLADAGAHVVEEVNEVGLREVVVPGDAASLERHDHELRAIDLLEEESTAHDGLDVRRSVEELRLTVGLVPHLAVDLPFSNLLGQLLVVLAGRGVLHPGLHHGLFFGRHLVVGTLLGQKPRGDENRRAQRHDSSQVCWTFHCSFPFSTGGCRGVTCSACFA